MLFANDVSITAIRRAMGHCRFSWCVVFSNAPCFNPRKRGCTRRIGLHCSRLGGARGGRDSSTRSARLAPTPTGVAGGSALERRVYPRSIGRFWMGTEPPHPNRFNGVGYPVALGTLAHGAHRGDGSPPSAIGRVQHRMGGGLGGGHDAYRGSDWLGHFSCII